MSDPPPPNPNPDSEPPSTTASRDEQNLVRELAAEVVDLRRRLDFFRHEQDLLLRPAMGLRPSQLYEPAFHNPPRPDRSSVPSISSVPPPLPPAGGGSFLSLEDRYIDVILEERRRHQARLGLLERRRAEIVSGLTPSYVTADLYDNRTSAADPATFGIMGELVSGPSSFYPPSMGLPPPPRASIWEQQGDAYSRLDAGLLSSRSAREEYDAAFRWANRGPPMERSWGGGHGRGAFGPSINNDSLLGRHALPFRGGRPSMGCPPGRWSSASIIPAAAAAAAAEDAAAATREQSLRSLGGGGPTLYPGPVTHENLSRQFALEKETAVSEDSRANRAGHSPSLVTRGASTDSESTVQILSGKDFGAYRDEKQVIVIPDESYAAQSRTKVGSLLSTSRKINSPPSDEVQLGLPATKRRLPVDFVPSPNTVVLGKGNGPKVNAGNLRLKRMVEEHLEEYARGERREKIAVISNLIRHVRRTDASAGFVKHEDDHWWEVTERDARVKVTALFRDCLHDKYRSSSASKVRRRQQLREHAYGGGSNKSSGGAHDEYGENRMNS